MEWTSDVAAGTWIRESLDPGLGTSMHGVVPRGFAAYARIFHRAHAGRLPGRAMPTPDEWVQMRDGERERLSALIRYEPTTWAETAAAFGTRMHPEAQWNRLVRSRDDWRRVRAPDGREFDAPREGHLDPDLLATIAGHLAGHTGTPGDGYFGVWNGWGGLLGFYGETPSRTFLQVTRDDTSDAQGGEADAASDDALRRAAESALLSQHNAMLGRSIHDSFNTVLGRPSWQPGILPDAVSSGAQLDLPGRAHILFRGGISELARPDWPSHVPWRDVEAEARGFAPDPESPSLIWPADRAWVVVTEVDFDSTIVGGSAEVIAELCGDPALEALPLRAGADLTWDGDEVNR
ncbi:hypothetical protein [Microbacterium sp. P03]|uniref:hypothetical protein n=1 Tax=Microbacterium sp. P03 TaxID=3366946 RepID=UPI003744D390